MRSLEADLRTEIRGFMVLMLKLCDWGVGAVGLNPNFSFFFYLFIFFKLLLIEVWLQQNKKVFSLVRIILLNKTCTYQKLVFVPGFIFCSNPKAQWLFVWGGPGWCYLTCTLSPLHRYGFLWGHSRWPNSNQDRKSESEKTRADKM